MNSKLEAISGRLEHFVKQIDILKLQSVTRRVSYTRISDSLVQPVVVAREDDKEKLLNMLLSDDDEMLNNMGIGVITILGMGGLGKTTLAQQLYNNSEVQKQFDLTAWAWASDDFDIFRVTKNLVESVTKKACESTNLDVLRVELRNSLKDKKFLLVLDDFWNEKYNDWDYLITPFTCGKKGSKIIVTTRQPRVAEVTSTFPIYELKLLTDENCWQILTKHAFGNEGYDKYPILEEIGRKIARKCDGLPLAAKTLGGLLRSNINEEEWNKILNSNLWSHDDVLPALRISYLHLPANLKRCFAYCSIFPKKHLLDREELILLWMAEGFLQHSNGEKAYEIIGDDYFNEFLSRSLIQKAEEYAKEMFRMHDLIYDLARLVSGKSSLFFEGNQIPKDVRHLSFSRGEYDGSKRFEDFYELHSLRTFLPHSELYNWRHYITRKVSDQLLPKLKYLRVMSLAKYINITELPHSIGNLVHLRYLDLSFTMIRSLPEETFTLYNLQTLKLSECVCLSELPRQIGNLVNLRHLDVSYTNLVEMPTQISKLKHLRCLSTFVVGKQNGLSIRELTNFPHLQGKLSILKLQNVVDPMDAYEAKLNSKEEIEELELEWGSNTEDSQIEKNVLEKLYPSTNIRKLNIRYYGGTSFPNWVGDSSFSNIISLRISDCNYCFSLPPFGQLPSLKELFISKMKMVQTVGNEFYCSTTESSPFHPFPLLESLKFEDMLEWQVWLPFKGEGSNFPFPCLIHLNLRNCPNLKGNLPKHLPSLSQVSILECKQLEMKSSDLQWNTSFEELNITEMGNSSMTAFENYSYRVLRVEKCDSLQSLHKMILTGNCLQYLKLHSIPSLISFPTVGLPTSLRSLIIRNCKKLEFLWVDTWHRYKSLESLSIIESCDSLASFPLGCFPSLKRLQIVSCPNLEAITRGGGEATLNLFVFEVNSCEKLKCLSEQIVLPALQFLFLFRLPQLASLPQGFFRSSLKFLFIGHELLLSHISKPELRFQFQCLNSLSEIYICGSGDEDQLNTLLKDSLLPTSIVILTLHNFRGLKFLEGKGLQRLTSLRELEIINCTSLESLPEDQLPSSLTVLKIRECPLLEARYQSPKGRHWAKNAHISAIEINEVII